jgi:hypothetical protein
MVAPMATIKPLSLLAVIALLAIGWFLLQTQQHAVERHTAVLVEPARGSFCGKDGSGAHLVSKLQSKLDYHFYLCFLDNATKVALQVTYKEAGDPASREITTIPAEHISKPINYIRSIIKRDLLELVDWKGNLPDWFMSLWTK